MVKSGTNEEELPFLHIINCKHFEVTSNFEVQSNFRTPGMPASLGWRSWSAMEGLAKAYPDTTWVRDQRYVQDGQVISTTGVTASIPMSLALVEAIGGDAVAQATANYWSANPVTGTENLVIVGYDRRFLSDQFGRRTAEVFAGNGFSVVLTPDPTPTPSVSFAVKRQHAVGGIMITASHNPPMFNGFKLKSDYGGSAESATCQAVENLLDRHPVQSTAEFHCLSEGHRTYTAG